MFKNLLFLLLLVLVISQFLRPDKNESSYLSITNFEESAGVTAEVKLILENNCYDCHTTFTRYPWYMQVSPISHWMAHQIEEGKEHFNISDWESYTVKQKDHKLEEFIEELEKKEMPLKPYTWVHGELSSSDSDVLINWAMQTRKKLMDTIAPKTDTLVQESLIQSRDSIQ